MSLGRHVQEIKNFLHLKLTLASRHIGPYYRPTYRVRLLGLPKCDKYIYIRVCKANVAN